MIWSFLNTPSEEDIALMRAELVRHDGVIQTTPEMPRILVIGWRPVDAAPKGRDAFGKMHMVLLIGRYPGMQAWTDIRQCWWDDFSSIWERWPHRFPPTHYMPSPEPPVDMV